MRNASCEQAEAVLLIDDMAFRRAGMTLFLAPWAESEGLMIVPAGLDFASTEITQRVRLILLINSTLIEAGLAMDLIDGLKQAFPGTPIAVLTDTENADTVRMACSLGVHGYIPTNLEPSVALKALSFVLAGGQCFPPRPPLDEQAEHDRPATAAEFNNDWRLTLRQQEILEGLQQGHPNKVIARNLNITEATVKLHVRHIMRKLGVNNRTQVALTTFARAESA